MFCNPTLDLVEGQKALLEAAGGGGYFVLTAHTYRVLKSEYQIVISNNVLANRTSLVSHTSILPKLGPATPCEAPASTLSTSPAQTCLGDRRFKKTELEETQNLMETVKTLLLFKGCAVPHRVKSKTFLLKYRIVPMTG